MLRKLFRGVLSILVLLVIFRVAVRYNESAEGGIIGLVEAVIDGIADVVFRWVPVVFETVKNLFS